MSYTQLRLNKTEDVQAVLNSLKQRYPLLSEVDIVKLSLTELNHSTLNSAAKNHSSATELRAAIQAGIDSGGYTDSETVFKELREYIATQ